MSSFFFPDHFKCRAVLMGRGVSDHVYRAWWTLDPLFLPRMFLRDWLHPRSPLSSSELVKAAFFCPSFPIDWVKPFERLMAEYESLRWPISTMWRGYVDPRRVLLGCGMRLFVLAAELDQLMKMDLMLKTTAEYACALKQIRKDGYDIKGGEVEFASVEGSGHHLMNDLQFEDALRIFEGWLEKLNDDNNDQ